METYKTVVGSDRLNEFIKLGWKRVHVFTKPTEWDDNSAPVDYDAAFVFVWDSPGEPLQPKKLSPEDVQPLGIAAPTQP